MNKQDVLKTINIMNKQVQISSPDWWKKYRKTYVKMEQVFQNGTQGMTNS